MPIRFLRICGPLSGIFEKHTKLTSPLLTLIQSHRQKKLFASWRAPSATKGVIEEKQTRALLSLLGIDYDTLTKGEFVTLIGILNKSEHMKKHISRRGKAQGSQMRKKKR